MQTILVAVDLSEFTGRVVDAAAAIATGGGGVLHLLHVIRPPAGFHDVPSRADGVREQVERDEARCLDRLAAEAARVGVRVSSTTVVHGEPAAQIVKRGKELNADLIVVGANADGVVVRTLLGSVSTDVLRDAARPVLIIPTTDDPPGAGRPGDDA